MEENGGGGVLATSGGAVNANTINVVVRVFGGNGFVPGDAVRIARVLEVVASRRREMLLERKAVPIASICAVDEAERSW